MPKRIHTQGDLDGACFLYALANAFTALTGAAPELDRWDHAISTLRWPSEFQMATVGTTNHYRKDPTHLVEAAESVLAELTHGRWQLQVQRWPDHSLDGIARAIDPLSVALLWYQGETRFNRDGDHWVCAMTSDGPPIRLQIACSIRFLDADRHQSPYHEEHHETLGRYTNDWISPEMNNRIMADCVLRVSRVD